MGNLHLRFDEGRGTFPVPSYSTGSEGATEPRPQGAVCIGHFPNEYLDAYSHSMVAGGLWVRS